MQVLRDFHKRHAFVLSLTVALMACSDIERPVRVDAKTLAQAEALLDDTVVTEASLTPEVTSRLGLEETLIASAKRRFRDVSQASFERQRLLRLDLATRLGQTTRLPMDNPLGRDLALTRLALQDLVVLQASGKGHISLSQTRVYTIDPYAGLWIEGPQTLVRDHVIETAEDAEAYISRMMELADGLHDTRRRLLADAATGHLPPVALLRQTRDEIDRLLADGALQAILETLETFSISLPDTGSTTQQMRMDSAERIYQTELLPAYMELAQTLSDLENQAPIAPGLWTQPGGVTLYNDLLQVWADPASRVDTLWNTLEVAAPHSKNHTTSMTEGDLGDGSAKDRPAADESPDPADKLLQIEARLSDASGRSQIRARHRLTVMPITGLNFLAPRYDDKRPAIIEYDSDLLTQLPPDLVNAYVSSAYFAATQRYDTAVQAASRRSLIRAYMQDLSFKQAWLAYGYIINGSDPQAVEAITQFQTALATADLGLHAKRWTLDQTETFLLRQTEISEDMAKHITLRLSANPGHAVGVYVHLQRFQSLETRARQILGARFDELSFQDILLFDGPRPLSIVESDVEAWYESLITTD
ncbi:MAG: DUF885 family protein [Pseudomonadota bacterium]